MADVYAGQSAVSQVRQAIWRSLVWGLTRESPDCLSHPTQSPVRSPSEALEAGTAHWSAAPNSTHFRKSCQRFANAANDLRVDLFIRETSPRLHGSTLDLRNRTATTKGP